MSQSERIENIRNKNLTVNKTYPPYVEHKNIVVDHKAVDHIDYETVKDELTQVPIIEDPRIMSSPRIYKNEKTNKYYIRYLFGLSEFKSCLFDVTDDYDWEKVIQEKSLKKEFRLKEEKHIIPIFGSKIYYPGTEEYDSKYPPIKTI